VEGVESLLSAGAKGTAEMSQKKFLAVVDSTRLLFFLPSLDSDPYADQQQRSPFETSISPALFFEILEALQLQQFTMMASSCGQ
jgi:hypothetical protein